MGYITPPQRIGTGIRYWTMGCEDGKHGFACMPPRAMINKVASEFGDTLIVSMLTRAYSNGYAWGVELRRGGLPRSDDRRRGGQWPWDGRTG